MQGMARWASAAAALLLSLAWTPASGLHYSGAGDEEGAGAHPPRQQTAADEPPRHKRITGPDHPRCGFREKRRVDMNIIGGSVVTNPTEFPFVAWIGDNDGTRLSQFCGGTLISERIVLTAGHCLYRNDMMNAQIWVRLQVPDFAKSDGVARNVINWRRHPQFSTVTLQNDLTLLLLNESIPASVAEPVSLSDGSNAFERTGNKTVVGWGSLDEQCQFYDTFLRKATVPMGSMGPECSTIGSKTLTKRHDFDASSQVCAGDYSGRMHYPGCGDSGGPLLAPSASGKWEQVGMVSWSYGVPYPDVFTRVSHFLDWISAAALELSGAGEHPAVAALKAAELAVPSDA